MTLSARDISVQLGEKRVLRDVSAEFQVGQITAVVGPNGAGKSTLLACLAGLRSPDGGVAKLDGHDVRHMNARERGRRIGFLPQTPEIAWQVEVRTLVGLGRTPYLGARGLGAEDQAAVDRAMIAAAVEPLQHRIVTSLSGGERGRVLIARVLAGEPEWLLADEPLTGLDPGHQLDALDLLRSLAREGRGVLVTLHDLGAALRFADRVLVLADGAIAADGPPLQALSPDVLQQVYGVEAQLVDGLGGPVIEIVGRRRA